MQLPARTENQHLAEAVAGKLGRGVSEVSEPFVTSQKANTNTHTHMQREVELNDVPETFKLLSSFSFPQGILWLCCKACCHFFYYPKLTVLWHFLKTKPFPTSSTVNFSPSYQITVPTSTSRPLAGVTLVEVAMALCCPGAAPRLPGWHGRQSECVSEGGQLAAGRTTPTLGFFLPSQLSRAVIAGLSSDEWLLFPPPDCNRLASRTV